MLNLDYDIKLSDREKSILMDLYRYRVMTTEQIKKRHFNNTGTYVNKVLWKLRTKKLIKSHTLSKSRKGKKGYSYHRLTEIGIECLAKHEMSIEGQSSLSSLYVKPRQVPYILMLNDIVVDLTNSKWKVWDSRYVKNKYNLDKRMNIQGLMVSPDQQDYGLYVLGNDVNSQTIGKIQSEIRLNSTSHLNNYIVVAKGLKSYMDFIKKAVEVEKENDIKVNKLITGNPIKVYLYKPFILHSLAFEDELDWIKTLCEFLSLKLKSTTIPEGERQSFPYIVEYEGKEYYLVDLTDSDLQKYYDIEVYIKSLSSRKWEGRDIIAVSLSIPTIANRNIENANGVKFVTLTGKEFNSLCTANL